MLWHEYLTKIQFKFILIPPEIGEGEEEDEVLSCTLSCTCTATEVI